MMDEVPRYFAPYHSQEMPPLAKEAPSEQAVAASGAEPPTVLARLVDELTVAGCYAIEWVLRDNSITYRSHYNPAWRIEGAKKQGLNGLYTTESMKYGFEVGQGLVGKVFQAQKRLFVPDLQVMDPEAIKDAMQSWDDSEFQRSALAEKYGIRAALFVPSPKGVIEVGSSTKSASLEEFFNERGREFLAKGGLDALSS